MPGISYGREFPPFIYHLENQYGGENTNSDEISTINLPESIRSTPPSSINPKNAMFRSLCIPGWGQYTNGKKIKSVIFITAELICTCGYLYENNKLKHDATTEWAKDSYRTNRNTFIIYWVAARIIGMMDAYVDAHLADFNVEDITPTDLPQEISH